MAHAVRQGVAEAMRTLICGATNSLHHHAHGALYFYIAVAPHFHYWYECVHSYACCESEEIPPVCMGLSVYGTLLKMIWNGLLDPENRHRELSL